MEKGDYCVGQSRNDSGARRTFLFRVTDSTLHKGIVSGVMCHDEHVAGKKQSIEVPKKDLLVNLGADPQHGKVYGVDVSNLFRGKNHHDYFGPIHWFYTPEKALGKELMLAFDRVHKLLKHNQLDFVIDPESCIWEVLPFHGEKYAGMYRRMKNPVKSPHRLQIRPEIMPSGEWKYVIVHELAHHLDFEHATSPKLRAAWIRLFNTSIKLTTIKKDKSSELLENLLSGEERPSEFRGTLSDEDSLIYRWILRTIQKDAALSVKELDILFEADSKDDIRSVWPLRTIPHKELEPVISEYACKNVRECFAEAVSYHLTGKKLPANVVKLLEKTFSYCRMNAAKEK